MNVYQDHNESVMRLFVIRVAGKEFEALKYPLSALCCLKAVGLKHREHGFELRRNKSFLSGGKGVGIPLNVCGFLVLKIKYLGMLISDCKSCACDVMDPYMEILLNLFQNGFLPSEMCDLVFALISFSFCFEQ